MSPFMLAHATHAMEFTLFNIYVPPHVKPEYADLCGFIAQLLHLTLYYATLT